MQGLFAGIVSMGGLESNVVMINLNIFPADCFNNSLKFKKTGDQARNKTKTGFHLTAEEITDLIILSRRFKL